MNEIMLETKNLCKTFRRQSVVQNISLSVSKHSIYGLLGPNGAGKSTTLKMITGMLSLSCVLLAEKDKEFLKLMAMGHHIKKRKLYVQTQN